MPAFAESKVPHQTEAVHVLEELLDVKCSCGGHGGSVWCPIHDERELMHCVEDLADRKAREESEDRVVELEEEVDSLKQSATDLESDLDDAQESAKERLEKIIKLEEEVDSLTAETARLQAELDAHKAMAAAVGELVQVVDGVKGTDPKAWVALGKFIDTLGTIEVPA